MDGVAASGETVTAATALAGLILVYLGSLAASFGTFQPQEQKTVRPRYQKRAWVAFAGLAIALLSASLGVLGKWLPNECMANAAVIILLVAFAWGIGIALLTAQEVG
ncbi:MAG: hypothetical protein V7704_08690 [Aurantimonas endophytica]|uniref:hypothetical protein n=1 Tax=Aurantimonas endophytica TaxID=1522175 RepID=UPI003002DF12